jgi:hypothetical protein
MTVAPQLLAQLAKKLYSPAVAFCPPTIRGVTHPMEVAGIVFALNVTAKSIVPGAIKRVNRRLDIAISSLFTNEGEISVGKVVEMLFNFFAKGVFFWRLVSILGRQVCW